MKIFSGILRRLFLLTLVWVALPATVSAAGGWFQEKSVLAARDAYLAGDSENLARHAEKIRGHVLEPYVAFWLLRLRIEEAGPVEIKDFLARNEGTLVAEQLRREWLLILGKNGQWERFREQRPLLVRSNRDIAGYALQERWQRQDASVFPEIRSFWNSPQALPAGCEPVADAMLQAGELTPREIRDRFRSLVRANLITEAQRLAAKLPAGEAPSAVLIDAATETPALFLEQSSFNVETVAGREPAIAAITCLARKDPLQAFRFWGSLQKEPFPEEDRRYVWGVIAVQAALRHFPEALDWFVMAGKTLFSDEQLAWRARAALRRENWPEVKDSIERMSPAGKSEPAWIYWLARSLFALGAQEEGKALLDRISGEHHFYGLLAAAESGKPLVIPPKASPPGRKEIAAVAERVGIQRSLALYRLGLRTEADAEWRWSVRTMDDRELLAAAELAKQNEIWDRVINTANRTVADHDYTLRYPAPYHKALSKQARIRKIDESFLYGLIRQESRFVAEARSSAGATGLMQLMPATARIVAKKTGMKRFHLSRLEQPEVNITLGAFYLREALDRFGDNAVLAAAAYNAGPGRARRWCDEKPLDGAIYVETIPFTETRQYVKQVMVNTVFYSAFSGGQISLLKTLLGTIGGTTAIENEPEL
jgi:soluble lytic murein transglycosylase